MVVSFLSFTVSLRLNFICISRGKATEVATIAVILYGDSGTCFLEIWGPKFYIKFAKNIYENKTQVFKLYKGCNSHRIH